MEYLRWIMMTYLVSVLLLVITTNKEVLFHEEIMKSIKAGEEPFFYKVGHFIPFVNTAMAIEWIWDWAFAGFSIKNKVQKYKL